MKGDFSRLNFDARKGYTAVLLQQGRAQLDSDWNEQAAILEHLGRTRFDDVVGGAVVPNGVGFEVHRDANGALALSAGRLYAGGLVCELEAETPISLVARRALRPAQGRTDLVYLDAWERIVSPIDDPSLLDPALGGRDTAFRLQCTWAIDFVEGVADRSCADAAALLPEVGRGRLTVEAPGGYSGTDNRLYRVEIHDGGALGQATFKWSRNNGCLAYVLRQFVQPDAVVLAESLADPEITVNAWFEISSGEREQLGLPGTLARLRKWSEETREATFDRDVSAYAEVARPRARRWDQPGDATLRVTRDWTDLESGIRVRFSGSDFRAGDYWTIPARPGSEKVTWFAEAPAQGVKHELCPLALVTWDRADVTQAFEYRDCRPVVAPLKEMYAELLRLRADVADLRRRVGPT